MTFDFSADMLKMVKYYL